MATVQGEVTANGWSFHVETGEDGGALTLALQFIQAQVKLQGEGQTFVRQALYGQTIPPANGESELAETLTDQSSPYYVARAKAHNATEEPQNLENLQD